MKNTNSLEKLNADLENFLFELKEYKQLLKEPEGKAPYATGINLADVLNPYVKAPPTRETIRETIVRRTGTLKDEIIRLTGKKLYKQFGDVFDPWSEALNLSSSLAAKLTALNFCIDATNEAIGKLEAERDSWGIANKKQGELTEKPAETSPQMPKAFIAHGGESEARSKLCQFLIALGVIPLVIEEEPTEGRSVNEQVEHYLKQADCAIVLGTADDKELKDGRLYPRRNVHIEIGRFQERFPKRIIYLLEEGASFPSDISEKLYTRFTQGSMDEAFITIARELKTLGIIKTLKLKE